MGIRKYAVKRILTGFVTFLVVIAMNYFLFRLPMYILGISPAELYGFQKIFKQGYQPQQAEEIIEELRVKMGIPPEDASIWLRLQYFGRYIYNMLTFNFGESYFPPGRGKPVLGLLMARLPKTVLLIGLGVFISMILGIWLGAWAAYNPGGKRDKAIVGTGLGIYAVPPFWLQLVCIYIFAVVLNIFPVAGGTSTFLYDPTLFNTIDLLYTISLPVLTLVLINFGFWIVLMRNAMASTMSEDYIFTARAKGLDEEAIIYGHALRNAILPVWTNILIAVANIWTGAIITERLFTIRGVGNLLLESVYNQNYPLEQLIFFFIAFTTIAANILADLTYGLLDPRVRYD